MTEAPYNPADDPDVSAQDEGAAPGTEPPKPEPEGEES